MCMWFWYNPWVKFCHFFHFVNCVIFWPQILWKSIDSEWVPCRRNSLYNFIPIFMQLCTPFFHGLKICMWLGFNPAVNFWLFSFLLTLSFVIFFATEVRSLFFGLQILRPQFFQHNNKSDFRKFYLYYSLPSFDFINICQENMDRENSEKALMFRWKDFLINNLHIDAGC